jgi:hypothetical protein
MPGKHTIQYSKKVLLKRIKVGHVIDPRLYIFSEPAKSAADAVLCHREQLIVSPLHSQWTPQSLD